MRSNFKKTRLQKRCQAREVGIRIWRCCKDPLGESLKVDAIERERRGGRGLVERRNVLWELGVVLLKAQIHDGARKQVSPSGVVDGHRHVAVANTAGPFNQRFLHLGERHPLASAYEAHPKSERWPVGA